MNKKITEHILNAQITKDVLSSIDHAWKVLKTNIVEGIQDNLVECKERVIYISKKENLKEVKQKLKAKTKKNNIKIKRIPRSLASLDEKHTHGILYIPYDYYVPGGRFNEMYGWDSFFINKGLIADGKIEDAKHMVDNQIYQINYYGKVLNANRTYYLDRSSQPFIGAMAWDIYKKTQNRKWLKEEVLPAIEKQYNYFLKASHYVKNINLFRYYSYSCRPAYEVLHSKCPTEKLYFEKVKFYFEEFYNKKFKTYYDKEQEKLTSKFFRADRSVRESGFDISGQFGMFSYAINEFNPTSLNSLLYINLNVLSMGYAALGEDEKAEKWMKVRDELGKSINKHLWNEKEETYYSYNFRRKKISDYLYASTFYPWWAKIPEQKNKDKLLKPLSLLEQNGGIICSLKDTDKQWDFPFGWAPLQYIAFKALLNYGYEEHARRLALKWINTVNNYFEKFGSVFEKYNMIENEHPNIEYGYASNEIGFGWTNGVYMYFYKYLTKDK